MKCRRSQKTIDRSCHGWLVFGPASGALSRGRFGLVADFAERPLLSVQRGAPGGTRWRRWLGRSALRTDCAAVLDSGSRGKTRYAPCRRCARTIAASMLTKRAARADPESPLLAAPHSAATGHRLPRNNGVCSCGENHRGLHAMAPLDSQTQRRLSKSATSRQQSLDTRCGAARQAQRVHALRATPSVPSRASRVQTQRRSWASSSPR
jgi:hypothetical protein